MNNINRSTVYYLILIAIAAIITFIAVYKLGQKPTQPIVTASAQTEEVVLSNSNPSSTITLNTLSTVTITITISNAAPSSTYTIQYGNQSTSITTNSSGTATTTITYTPSSNNTTFEIIITGPGISNNNNNQLELTIVFTQPSSTPTPTPTPTPTTTPTPNPTNYAQYLCSQGYFGNGICIYQQQITITSTPRQPGNGIWVFQNYNNIPVCVAANQFAGTIPYCFPNCSKSCSLPSCFATGSTFYPLGCLPPNGYGYYPQEYGSGFTEFYFLVGGAIYAGVDASAYDNYVIPLLPLPSSFQQGYVINNTGRPIAIQVTNYQSFANNITNSWTIAIDNNVTLPVWYDSNTVFTINYYGNPATYKQFTMPSNGQLVVTSI